jgi:hypothetical protein
MQIVLSPERLKNSWLFQRKLQFKLWQKKEWIWNSQITDHLLLRLLLLLLLRGILIVDTRYQWEDEYLYPSTHQASCHLEMDQVVQIRIMEWLSTNLKRKHKKTSQRIELKVACTWLRQAGGHLALHGLQEAHKKKKLLQVGTRGESCAAIHAPCERVIPHATWVGNVAACLKRKVVQKLSAASSSLPPQLYLSLST